MNKHILSVEQVQRLRDVCSTITPKGKRDIAILDTMLYQGLRLKEVANLQLESFRFVDGQIMLQLKGRISPIKVHKILHHSLRKWMDQRGIPLENTTGPVFIPLQKSNKNSEKSLGRQAISHLVAKYGSLAGVTPAKGKYRLTPGDLSRTCARVAYDRGADLLSLQAFLGFNHIETVARYIGVLELKDPNSVIDQIAY
jgi:site-specific recombinase XerD